MANHAVFVSSDLHATRGGHILNFVHTADCDNGTIWAQGDIVGQGVDRETYKCKQATAGDVVFVVGSVPLLPRARTKAEAAETNFYNEAGDIMRMYIKVENNVITDVTFKTFGCGAAIATSSMATELIKGKTIDEALKLTNRAVMEALDGLPPVKVHCSVLAEQAIKAAVADYYTRQGIDPTPIVGKIEDCDHHDHCGCGEH